MSSLTEEKIYKAPVITFMGHVDSGKTTLQDAISKNTTSEHGGITQNIGTRYIDNKTITNLGRTVKGKFALDSRLPGILLIDTPGHEAFKNIRSQGSNICDLAVLVIDILDGVKPQTIESINILKENKIPFVIALTKLDKIEGWVDSKEKNLRKALKKNSSVNNMLNASIEDIKWELAKQEINAEFYFNNKKPATIYSMIPLSSITMEGVADLICMISYLTFNWMSKKVTFTNKIKASVLKSYKDNRLGWTVELILSNGYLNVGEEYYLCNYYNPVKCKIKNIQVNINGKWTQTTSAIASSYCRIIGTNLEDIITGTYMYSIEQLSEEKALQKATNNISDIWKLFKYSDGGYIVAPSFGELAGCYYQLTKEIIPISKCIIGKLNESMIDRIYMMLENKPLAQRVIYYFGSLDEEKINKYIKLKNYSLKIITDNIIYNIVDKSKQFIEESNDTEIDKLIKEGLINYPVKCRIVPDCVFNQGGSSEIVIGLKVMEGKLVKNTKLYVNNNSSLINLGIVISLEKNNEELEEAHIGDKIAVKLSNPDGKTFNRHFEDKNVIFSYLSRDIINNLKKYYRKKLSKKEWLLVKDLKQEFNII